jgi:hypothetical protein
VLVLGGQAAAIGATHLVRSRPGLFDGLHVLQCPHTSPQSINPRPWASGCVRSTFRAAKLLADQSKSL